MKNIKTKEEKEDKRPVIEIITKEDCEKIAKMVTPVVRAHYLDYDEVIGEFEFSAFTGYCFDGEFITAIGVISPSSDLYPADNTDCFDFETKEDFNYYVIVSETEALIKSPQIDEKPYGLSEVKHYFFIKSRKIQKDEIDCSSEEKVTVKVYADDFMATFKSGEDAPCVEFSIPLDEAADDYAGTMDQCEEAICAKFEEVNGTIGNYTMSYLGHVFDETRRIVYNKINGLKDSLL